jgi:hypothetical protein
VELPKGAVDAFICTPSYLKHLFEKTGVRSWRDLVGTIFFSYSEPRVSDNEQRAMAGQPLRGGPLDRR